MLKGIGDGFDIHGIMEPRAGELANARGDNRCADGGSEHNVVHALACTGTLPNDSGALALGGNSIAMRTLCRSYRFATIACQNESRD